MGLLARERPYLGSQPEPRLGHRIPSRETLGLTINTPQQHIVNYPLLLLY